MTLQIDDDTIDWLMSSDIPAVRERTLIDLSGRGVDDPQVVRERKLIMTEGPVPKILAKQRPAGCWGEEADFYQRSRYHGSCWNVHLLAQFGADPADERIRAACEFMLEASQHRESGAFSYRGTRETGGTKKGILPCLTANMVFSMAKMGFSRDERVLKAASWMAETMRFEPKGVSEKAWPYHYDLCWRNRTCRLGAVKWLKAINALESSAAPLDLSDAKKSCAEYLLSTCFGRDPTQPSTLARPEWYHFSYPHLYDTDLLEIGHALYDSRLFSELSPELGETILAVRDKDGRWTQQGQMIKKLSVVIERPGAQSKCVTLLALSLLRKLEN